MTIAIFIFNTKFDNFDISHFYPYFSQIQTQIMLTQFILYCILDVLSVQLYPGYIAYPCQPGVALVHCPLVHLCLGGMLSDTCPPMPHPWHPLQALQDSGTRQYLPKQGSSNATQSSTCVQGLTMSPCIQYYTLNSQHRRTPVYCTLSIYSKPESTIFSEFTKHSYKPFIFCLFFFHL